MELMLKSIWNLAGSDYAFLTSFVVVIFATHLFIMNLSKNFRSSRVAVVTFMIMLYCGLYQSGSLRWEFMGYSNGIQPFDTNLWVCIDIFCFSLLFSYLWAIKVAMVRKGGYFRQIYLFYSRA